LLLNVFCHWWTIFFGHQSISKFSLSHYTLAVTNELTNYPKPIFYLFVQQDNNKVSLSSTYFQLLLLQLDLTHTSTIVDVQLDNNDHGFRLDDRSVGSVTTRSVVDSSETSKPVSRIISGGKTAFPDHLFTGNVSERGIVSGLSGSAEAASLSAPPQQVGTLRVVDIFGQGEN
jgi:hypothetical protein